MKIGITIAKDRETQELSVILGPNVPIKEQNSFLKDAESLAELAEGFDFVCLITSTGGMGKRKKLKLPVVEEETEI